MLQLGNLAKIRLRLVNVKVLLWLGYLLFNQQCTHGCGHDNMSYLLLCIYHTLKILLPIFVARIQDYSNVIHILIKIEKSLEITGQK